MRVIGGIWRDNMIIINLEDEKEKQKYKDIIKILDEEWKTTKKLEIFGKFCEVLNITRVEFVFDFKNETYKLIRDYSEEEYGNFFQNYMMLLNWDYIRTNVKMTSFNAILPNYFEIIVER